MLINTFHNDLIYTTQNTPCRVVATPSFGNSVDKPSTSAGLSFVMYTNELWLPVKGYEGLYEISNMGRVKALERVYYSSASRKARKVAPERIMLFRDNGHGYKTVGLCKDGKIKVKYIHRLVAEAFIPNPDNLPEVNHKHGDKSDNRASELEWCTSDKNRKHAMDTGLWNRHGEKHWYAKLTNQQAQEIRELYATGKYLQREIGDMYGINFRAVSQIVNYKRYTK